MNSFVSTNGNFYSFESENHGETIIHYVFKNNALTPCAEIRESLVSYDLFTYQKDLLTEQVEKYAYATEHKNFNDIIETIKEM